MTTKTKLLSLFLHKENQTILWHLIQKHPVFVSAFQYVNISPELWFRENIEECYDFFLDSIEFDQPPTDKVSRLLHLNKYCLIHLLKKLNSYIPVEKDPVVASGVSSPHSQSMSDANVISHNELHDMMQPALPNSSSKYSNIKLPDYEVPTFHEYNPEKLKKEKEQQAIHEFEKLKKNYDSLYSREPPQPANFTETIEKPNPEDMSSLLKMQEEMRKKDMVYQEPPPNMNADEFKKKTDEYFSIPAERNEKMKEDRIRMFTSIPQKSYI